MSRLPARVPVSQPAAACSRRSVFSPVRFRAVSASRRGGALPLRGLMLSERGYFPACHSCLEVVINAAQSSGGFPRASLLAKTVYGSVLLPEDRSVRWSLTHA